jgi:hypothetical protein
MIASRLAMLLAAAERLTVDLIAQDPVSISLARDTPAYARHVAQAENFDILPVRERDGKIVRYVSRSTLERHPSDTDWEAAAFEVIRADEIVSAATPLFEVVGRFDRQRRDCSFWDLARSTQSQRCMT